jgi:hypothetical protein
MKFRKRPVVIDAFQLTKEASLNNNTWPDWLNDSRIYRTNHSFSIDKDYPLTIKTLEGNMLVSINDWIIKGVKNELYPCKPDIFEETYEEVNDE